MTFGKFIEARLVVKLDSLESNHGETCNVCFRVDPQLKADLESACDDLGISIQEFMTRSLIESVNQYSRISREVDLGWGGDK